jgi:hypothetical protein
MNKTLIGKNDYLFLINDTNRELEVHCNNLQLVNEENLKRYLNIDNFLLIIFPNKSLVYKEYLPDNYDAKYRPAFDAYSKVLKDKIIDTYNVLKNEEDVYYKTDTHINMKGSYVVYRYFIQELNRIFNMNIQPKELTLSSNHTNLMELQIGIGDLLWAQNLGNQVVDNCIDTFYYSSDVEYIYCNHVIKINDTLRILSSNLIDQNHILNGSVIDWNILSNYILYQKNNTTNKIKVVIFYDSFLIALLRLYLDSFEEVYMIKDIYRKDIINYLKPDYVFEFRVERFLT